MRQKSRCLITFFVTKQRIELNPGHIGFCNIGKMAARTFSHRLFRGGRVIRQWMMPESVVTPAVGLGIPLTVFHRKVDAVELAIEIPASRWFRTRAVWKSRIKDPSQFFYNDRSFGKGTCLQICVDVFLFYVYVMIFGE